MPLFISDEEYERCSGDVATVTEKADEYIRELKNEVETVRAKADACSVTAEQTCSVLEHKSVSLSSELGSRNSELQQLDSDLALARSHNHRATVALIAKEGEIERLRAEALELQKSNRQFTDLLTQKDSEISEKNALIKAYFDKILNLTDIVSSKESRVNEVEEDLTRCNASCSRLLQEKELVERHNLWLNDELTTKVNSLIELRKSHGELEADLSSKIVDLERKLSESSSSLKWNKDSVMDLEKKLKSVQEDLSICQDTAAANEERHCAEMTTVNKLVELYKESSREWSKKAGALEGVIKALETRLSQTENDYKERLEKELSARTEIEKEAALLKEKLVKCEAELETSRRATENNLLSLSASCIEPWVDSVGGHDMDRASQMVVPNVPSGVSGTALAASLLRDGWSLVKMYTKYQEAADALRHEQLGRKKSEAILERVLLEIEEKAGVIMDERAEHKRFFEAYSAMNQKLQYSLSEQNNLERTIKELKADLKRCERDSSLADKEVTDLQKQVTILLKECQDVQLRCGSVADSANNSLGSFVEINTETNTGEVISERLVAYKDIHELVEQNVQLRSVVRKLSDQVEGTETELKEKCKIELQKKENEAVIKVNAVLARAEEQGKMIESLHTSVSMYKRLYEEEQRHHSSQPLATETNQCVQNHGRKNLTFSLEGPEEALKKAQEEAIERVRCLEDDLKKLRSEMKSLRSENDKLAKEADFARDKLDRNLKELDHQRGEHNSVISRNVEFSQLIIDYQRKLRESSDTVQAAEECSRMLNMEVSVLKSEKDMLSHAEKRACDEVRSLSERLYRLQATLDTLHSADKAREEANRMERRKQDDYVNQIQKEWAHAKKELDEEHAKIQLLTLDREEIRKNSFKQVEELRKDFSTLTNALAAAEARAAAAETQAADMEKIRSSVTLIDGALDVSSSCSNEALKDLCVAREEIKNLRVEAEISKAHMLQYKSIAQVNEDALKQMELAHENFKVEANKVRMSIEAEVVSLKERFRELESEYSLKFEAAVSSVAGTEAALKSSMSEIEQLEQEKSVKMSQIATLEIQVTSLKEELEKEHKNKHDAQSNYERQVILQSDTIQELTKTSKALASLQEEISDLRKFSKGLQTENSQLKSTWDCEKVMLEESKILAEKKYDELNEQNKILHIRLEAFHVKLAQKDCDFAGISSGSNDLPQPDAGLQNVVNYLRRAKEIAETEISLLKQEKLRMQSQLESALRATESAQTSLQAMRANSRAMVFTEDEFKSLQIQVREVNLLRESNVQLREENKNNFEECQKLREVAQKARMETEQREFLLREKQIELDASEKECQMLKLEKDRAEKKVKELTEKSRDTIDLEEYNRMRDEIKQLKTSLSEKNVHLVDAKKLLYEKDGTISELEKDLAKSRKELSEKENRINKSSQVEDFLRKEIAHFKKTLETLSIEKEELCKQNEALSKQFANLKQGRKDVDELIKEKEEKETKIKMLVTLTDRQRMELKKERDDLMREKAKRQKIESIIVEKIKSVDQEKGKLVDGLQKHKQARERLTNEVEKLKHAENSLPEGSSVVQILSGNHLEDISVAYKLAVENFERVAHSIASELGVPPAPLIAPVLDASTAVVNTGQTLPLQQDPNALAANTSLSLAKPTEYKKDMFLTTNAETRKHKRLLVRRPKKNDDPQVEIEMPEAEKSNIIEKPVSSDNIENKEVPTQSAHVTVRKRQDESLVEHDASSDIEAPALKKPKGSDSPQVTTEARAIAIFKNLETVPETSGCISDRPETANEESMDTENDDGETSGEKDEDQKLNTTNRSELQSESSIILEEFETNPNETNSVLDDEEMQQSAMVSEGEREEGELPPGGGNVGEEMVEDQPEPDSSPLFNDYIVDPTEEATVPQAVNDETDVNEGNEAGVADSLNEVDKNLCETDVETVGHQAHEAIVSETTGKPKKDGNQEKQAGDASDVKTRERKEDGSGIAQETPQVGQVSPAGTTINLFERARLRSALRQRSVQQGRGSSTPPPPATKGRGRISRGRGGRGPGSGGGRS